jgi:hypothetical protein
VQHCIGICIAISSDETVGCNSLTCCVCHVLVAAYLLIEGPVSGRLVSAYIMVYLCLFGLQVALCLFDRGAWGYVISILLRLSHASQQVAFESSASRNYPLFMC